MSESDGTDKNVVPKIAGLPPSPASGLTAPVSGLWGVL